MVGKGLHELRAIAGHGVDAHMREQRQQPGQTPARRQIRCIRWGFAVDQLVRQPAEQRSGQRQKEQRMRLCPVAHHVQQIVAMVNQHIQIGHRASYSANKSSFGKASAPAHDGASDAGAEHGLGQRVHVVVFLGRK